MIVQEQLYPWKFILSEQFSWRTFLHFKHFLPFFQILNLESLDIECMLTCTLSLSLSHTYIDIYIHTEVMNSLWITEFLVCGNIFLLNMKLLFSHFCLFRQKHQQVDSKFIYSHYLLTYLSILFTFLFLDAVKTLSQRLSQSPGLRKNYAVTIMADKII